MRMHLALTPLGPPLHLAVAYSMFEDAQLSHVSTDSLSILVRMFLLSSYHDASISLSRDRVHRLTAPGGLPLDDEMELMGDARDIAIEIVNKVKEECAAGTDSDLVEGGGQHFVLCVCV
jgi:hypothetical protein